MNPPRAGERTVAAALVATFALAACLALHRVDLHRFDTDQDAHFEAVREFLDTFRPPLVGTTNGWIHIGPLEYYAYLPVQALFPAPEASMRFGALLHLAALLLLLATLRRIAPDPAAFLPALLYAATDPFPLWFARDATNLSLYFPAACLFFYGLVRHLATPPDRPDGGALPLALCGLLLALQSHLVALALLAPLLLALVSGPPAAFRARAYAGPLLILALLYLPWALHECSTGFADLLGRFDHAGVAREGAGAPPALPVLLDAGRHGAAHGTGSAGLQARMPLLPLRARLLAGVPALCLLLLALDFCVGRLRGRAPATAHHAAAWTMLALLFLRLVAPGDYARYLLPLYPLFYLALAGALGRTFRATDRLLPPRAARLPRAAALCAGLLLAFCSATMILAVRAEARRFGFAGSDLTLERKRDVVARLAAEGFGREAVGARFHNLRTREPGGYAYLARLLAPGKGRDARRAYLVPEKPPVAGAPEGFEVRFAPSGIPDELTLRGPDDAPEALSQPVFLEPQGARFEVEVPFELRTGEARTLALFTRAVVRRVRAGGRTLLSATGEPEPRPVVRESLPERTFVPLSALPPGRHTLEVSLTLRDLWATFALADPPAAWFTAGEPGTGR